MESLNQRESQQHPVNSDWQRWKRLPSPVRASIAGAIHEFGTAWGGAKAVVDFWERTEPNFGEEALPDRANCTKLTTDVVLVVGGSNDQRSSGLQNLQSGVYPSCLAGEKLSLFHRI